MTSCSACRKGTTDRRMSFSSRANSLQRKFQNKSRSESVVDPEGHSVAGGTARCAAHLRCRFAIMSVCMPYTNVKTQPVARASEDIPPPGRFLLTLTDGKPPFGGPSCTNAVASLGPPMLKRRQQQQAPAQSKRKASPPWCGVYISWVLGTGRGDRGLSRGYQPPTTGTSVTLQQKVADAEAALSALRCAAGPYAWPAARTSRVAARAHAHASRSLAGATRAAPLTCRRALASGAKSKRSEDDGYDKSLWGCATAASPCPAS